MSCDSVNANSLVGSAASKHAAEKPCGLEQATGTQDVAMRICDVNNNYSPTGGGVRTYHHEKIRYMRAHPQHTYCLVVPSDRETWEQDGNIVHAHVPAVALGGSGYRMIVRSDRGWCLDC